MDMISVVVGSKMHINYEYGMDRNLLTNFIVVEVFATIDY